MSTRVTEISKSFRDEPGPVWDALARFQGQGWGMEDHDVLEDGRMRIVLAHNDLPGSYRVLEGES